jgi:hypothetical protein
MIEDLSIPLEELPGFLSTISMVEDDRREIIKGLIAAERKSPPRYDAARQLILRVLEGQIDYERAEAFAATIPDPIDKRCAEDVLNAAKPFLRSATTSPVGQLAPMRFEVRPELFLKVAPIRVRQLSEPRVLLLHVWDRPLNDRQVRAALAILKRALTDQLPAYSYRDIDFVTLSTPPLSARRSCRIYGWNSLPPMETDELDRFLGALSDAWSEYQRHGPRSVKRRGPPRLL